VLLGKCLSCTVTLLAAVSAGCPRGCGLAAAGMGRQRSVLLQDVDNPTRGGGEDMALGEKAVRMCSLAVLLPATKEQADSCYKVGMGGPGRRGGFQTCCLSEVVILVEDFMIRTGILHRVLEPLLKE